MVGGGPKTTHAGHKLCNGAKFNTPSGKCNHETSEAVFMFGGVGLMESPGRDFTAMCLTDEPGQYNTTGQSGGKPKYSWVAGGRNGHGDIAKRSANTTTHGEGTGNSWLGAKDWELYHSLCDLWQGDIDGRWQMIGACAYGLNSPVNRGVEYSLLVDPVNVEPFPTHLKDSGAYSYSLSQSQKCC